MRYTLYALIAVLAIVMLASPNTAPRAISAAPKPTPVGLQYDEITKMALPPATPVPPGSFHADYVAAMNAPSGGLPEGMDQDTLDQMKRMGIKMPSGIPGFGADHPMRYAFYKGWIRVDDLLAKTAEIRKCDKNQYIDLDLAKKTYKISSASTGTDTSGSYRGRGQNEGPGTAVMTVSRKASNLGSLTLDGVATKGYTLVNSMSIAQATGSCQNSSFTSTQTQYISGIRQPRAFCELRNPAVDVGAASGGCRPTLKSRGGMGGVPSDRLVMYSRMEMGTAGAPAMVTERGNVNVLYEPQAAQLFSIPSDFTQQP